MGNKNSHIKLDQPGKRYPFHYPEGYFDDLPIKIMTRIEAQSSSQKKSLFTTYLRSSLRVAATFLIIAAILFIPAKLIFFEKFKSNRSISQDRDNEYYISYHLSEQSIFEALESSSFDDTFDNDQLETVLLASVSEYDLIDLTN